MTHGVSTGDIEEKVRRLSAATQASEEQARDDRDARNQAIEEAEAAGMGIRQLARLTGLTPTHVQRLLIRMAADRQAGTRSN